MDPKPSPGAPAIEIAESPDAILRFLESVGRRSEAEFYLSLFRAESKESFANLVAGASVLKDASEAVVLDLRFLRALGLFPVVTVGFGSIASAAAEQAERLHRRLEKSDVPARVHAIDEPSLADAVTGTVRAGEIPIVAFTSGDPNNLATRFGALGGLSVELRTRKLIFLARRGGLRPRNSESELSDINLSTDYETIMQTRALAANWLAMLEQIRQLLVERATHRMFVAITSPLLLMRELFTIRGAGTLIKRGGIILSKAGLSGVDVPRLGALLRSSFGRDLLPDFFEHEFARVYHEENYRGAVILQQTPLGAYLCKFAVDREAQGEGLGRDLWQLVTAEYPTLFWRARPENPIVPFYIQECDGMARMGAWHVFWKGLASDRLGDAIAYALAQPVDFVAPAPALPDVSSEPSPPRF
jgi:acetylglutamate kinase